MKAPNINALDIDQMLTRTEITAGILRVVYSIQYVDDYTKEDASQALINLLDSMTYLDGPLEIKKEK